MVLLFVGSALAADWLAIQGLEPAEPAIRPWGFTQVVGEGVLAQPVTGLSTDLGAFDGQRPSFGTLGADGHQAAITVRRARVGLRGAIPGTDGKVGWLVAAEVGQSAITRVEPIVLTDASVTLSYVPYAHLRVGQFKLPIMDEALESNPVAAETVNPSNTALLCQESRVEDGAYTSGAGAFRDLGVEVFDAIGVGPLVVSYALMLSEGRPALDDTGPPRDLSARVSLTRVLDPAASRTDPHRHEISAFAWRLQGPRDGATRVREGIGVHLETAPVRVRFELVHARGALEVGPSPPFAGQPISVVADGDALGFTGFVHGEWRRLGATLLYDELHRDRTHPADARVLRLLTPGIGFEPTPRVRLLGEVGLRWIAAPDGSADARRVAAAIGPRPAAQVTVVF